MLLDPTKLWPNAIYIKLSPEVFKNEPAVLNLKPLEIISILTEAPEPSASTVFAYK